MQSFDTVKDFAGWSVTQLAYGLPSLWFNWGQVCFSVYIVSIIAAADFSIWEMDCRKVLYFNWVSKLYLFL